MYQVIFFGLVILNLYLIKETRQILIKTAMPNSYKTILLALFLLVVFLTRKYAENKMAISFPLLIFLAFFNGISGGLREKDILVFPTNTLTGRIKVSYRDIRKIYYEEKDGKFILYIKAHSTTYKLYFLKSLKEEVIKILQKKNVRIEKRK